MSKNGFVSLQGLFICWVLILHIGVLSAITTITLREHQDQLHYLKCYAAVKTAITYHDFFPENLPRTITVFEIPIYISRDDDYIYMEGSYKNVSAQWRMKQ